MNEIEKKILKKEIEEANVCLRNVNKIESTFLLMLPSQKKLLGLLQKKAMTSEELAKTTGLSPDGVRGRLSELRTKHHYDIKRIDGHYQLILSDQRNHADRILQFVESHHLSGRKILISILQENMQLSFEELTDALSELFKQNKLTQISKGMIIISS